MLGMQEMLIPVSSENPAGESQEYNTLYLELEALAVSTSPSQMGDASIDGREPDWHGVAARCNTLWESTRDLRVATYWTIAGWCTEGMAGLNEGLGGIEYLIRDMWESFWPQLDPDDDNDPLERLNILSMLSPQPGAVNDPIMFISRFRERKLLPELPYSLRDLMIANGELDAGEETIDLNLLTAEAMAVPVSQFEKALALVEEVTNRLNSISDLLNQKIANSYSHNFNALNAELKRLSAFYGKFCIVHNAESMQGSGESGEATLSAKNNFDGGTDFSRYCATNRAEALLLLRKASEYFVKAEPTSPVPYLISRALRMAEMNFLDLLGEIDRNALERGREQMGVITTDKQS